MYTVPIYLSLIIYKLNYHLIYFNKKKNIWLVLNIPNFLNIKALYYLKVVNKHFCYENGFKFIYLDRWYKYGTRYNLILDLFTL
jgi:hypothetical protein